MHWETKNYCDSLYCDIHFIVVVQNWTHKISEVCLYQGLDLKSSRAGIQIYAYTTSQTFFPFHLASP